MKDLIDFKLDGINYSLTPERLEELKNLYSQFAPKPLTINDFHEDLKALIKKYSTLLRPLDIKKLKILLLKSSIRNL